MCRENSPCRHMTQDCQATEESCIRRVPVFQNISTEHATLLATIIHSSTYAKGSFIFREGDPSDSLYVISEGIVKLSTTQDNGKEHLIRFLFPGDFLGQFALLQEKPCYAHAEVLEQAVICRIHRQHFKPLLEQNPALAYSFLLALSERLQQADEWAGMLQTLEVERRIAKLLLSLRQQSKGSSRRQEGRGSENPPRGEVLLPAPKKEMALLIGTTPETFSRRLTQLESEGFIQIDRRTIWILDEERLRQL